MIINLILFLIIIYRSFKLAEKIISKPPNEFQHIFAPPGSGKTTLASKIVKDAIKNNKRVYSNVKIAGAYKMTIKDIGVYDMSDSIMIIDEAGSDLSNRSWHTNLSHEAIKYLKKHRHYNIDIYTFSQSYGDVDNKFRELTTKILMLKKSKIPFFTKAMAIKKTIDLQNGQIVEFYEIDRPNNYRFFTPPLWAFFDSWEKGEKIKEGKPVTYIKEDIIGL